MKNKNQKEEKNLELAYKNFYNSTNQDWDFILNKLKSLIFSHIDFYLYQNECKHRSGEKSTEEWRAYNEAISDITSVIEFALDKERF